MIMMMMMMILIQIYDQLKNQDARRRLGAAVLEDGKLEEVESGILDNVIGRGRHAVVEFTAAQSAILEQQPHVRVSVRRFGRLDCPVVCT